MSESTARHRVGLGRALREDGVFAATGAALASGNTTLPHAQALWFETAHLHQGDTIVRDGDDERRRGGLDPDVAARLAQVDARTSRWAGRPLADYRGKVRAVVADVFRTRHAEDDRERVSTDCGLRSWTAPAGSGRAIGGFSLVLPDLDARIVRDGIATHTAALVESLHRLTWHYRTHGLPAHPADSDGAEGVDPDDGEGPVNGTHGLDLTALLDAMTRERAGSGSSAHGGAEDDGDRANVSRIDTGLVDTGRTGTGHAHTGRADRGLTDAGHTDTHRDAHDWHVGDGRDGRPRSRTPHGVVEVDAHTAAAAAMDALLSATAWPSELDPVIRDLLARLEPPTSTSSPSGEQRDILDALNRLLAARAVRDAVLTHLTEGPQVDAEGRIASVDVTVSVEVGVVMTADTLLALDDAPAYVTGHGLTGTRTPIPAALGRLLAADGTWRRLIADPMTGALLDRSPHSYQPSADLAAYVATRDQTCRIPWCQQPAHRRPARHRARERIRATAGEPPPQRSRPLVDAGGSAAAQTVLDARPARCGTDLDHARHFDHDDPTRGGTTTRGNLGALSRTHHLLKTHVAWDLRVHDPADPLSAYTWTSPLGVQHLGLPPAVIPHHA